MTRSLCLWIFVIAQVTMAQAPSACSAFAPGLTSGSADIRERSARSIYENCPTGSTASLPDLNSSLRKSVEMGNASAAALLLLGRWSDVPTREFLEKKIADKTTKVKLHPWQPPVPAGLAAAVAATSAGSVSARERLKAGLVPVEEAEFLASVVPAIQDEHALRLLMKLLEDERTVNTGVPSGAEPKLRITDLALEAYVKRFQLKPFPLRPGARYTPSEVEQVRGLIAKMLTP